MSGFEISEIMEGMESPSINEMQEQQEQLRLQADAAQEAGNVEKANYFLGEITKLEEIMESMESPSINEMQEQRDQLRLQVDAAQEAGNVEKANYFLGEITKLEEQLTQFETESTSDEMILGEGHSGGHSESYWKKEAAKELAEHGKTPWYYTCKKQLEEAIKNDVK